MNKRISLGLALAILLMVAAVTFSMTWVYSRNKFNNSINDLREREQMFEKVAEVDRLVRQNYYGSINDTVLMDSVAQGYLEGIGDKYSMYISAEEYKKLSQDDEEYVGIGAVIEQAPDDFYLVVTEIYPDSPAQVAGIEVGDLIVRIDDTDLTRENSRQMLESITGPQGSRITMVTRRGSEERPLVEMTRRAIAIPTVQSHMLEQSTPEEPLVGYIRIIEFGDRTYDQFNRELQTLLDQGAGALIFDVRDNKGGVLRSAARILDKLLPDGVIVSATYKDGTSEVQHLSDANQMNLPMAIITNAGTASAAEVFAQAIRDYDKGRIVGAVSAGKGVMQNLIRLSDGSAIDLTVAVLHTKSGATFNEIGVKPDFEVKLEGAWEKMDDIADTQRSKAKEVVIGMIRATEVPAEPVPEESPATQEEQSAPSESQPEPSAPESESSSESSGESSEPEEEEPSDESADDEEADPGDNSDTGE